jgi:hypothetical protein
MAMVGRAGESEAITGPGRGHLVRFLAACCRWRSSSPSASVWRGARETPEVAGSTLRLATAAVLTADGSPSRNDRPGRCDAAGSWSATCRVGLGRCRRPPRFRGRAKRSSERNEACRDPASSRGRCMSQQTRAAGASHASTTAQVGSPAEGRCRSKSAIPRRAASRSVGGRGMVRGSIPLSSTR